MGYHKYSRETWRYLLESQTTAHGNHTFNINLGYILSDDITFLQSWVFSGYSDKKQKACKISVEHKMRMATSHLTMF